MPGYAAARRRRAKDRLRLAARAAQAKEEADVRLPEGLRRDAIDFVGEHAVRVPLSSFLDGKTPRSLGFGQERVRNALERVKKVERHRPAAFKGADVYHVWLERLPRKALARLAEKMQARAAAKLRRLTYLEAMEEFGQGAMLLELVQDTTASLCTTTRLATSSSASWRARRP